MACASSCSVSLGRSRELLEPPLGAPGKWLKHSLRVPGCLAARHCRALEVTPQAPAPYPSGFRVAFPAFPQTHKGDRACFYASALKKVYEECVLGYTDLSRHPVALCIVHPIYIYMERERERERETELFFKEAPKCFMLYMCSGIEAAKQTSGKIQQRNQ